jgi:hypothetical protein
MSETYHIRIKKEYAIAIIEDLQGKDAVELLPEEEAFDVPQWQRELVRARIAKYTTNPELYIDEDTFFAMLNED